MGKTTSHTTEGHKFDKPMSRPLTYRQRFEIEYGSHFIPYLKILEKEIGREKVIETLHKLTLQEADEYARHVVKTKGKNDLSVFKEDYSPDSPVFNDIMTIEVLENTKTVYEIKITECLWAEVFRKAGMAEYGHAVVCSGDVPYACYVNSNIDLELEGTIMEGKPYCRLRYFVKP